MKIGQVVFILLSFVLMALASSIETVQTGQWTGQSQTISDEINQILVDPQWSSGEVEGAQLVNVSGKVKDTGVMATSPIVGSSIIIQFVLSSGSFDVRAFEVNGSPIDVSVAKILLGSIPAPVKALTVAKSPSPLFLSPSYLLLLLFVWGIEMLIAFMINKMKGRPWNDPNIILVFLLGPIGLVILFLSKDIRPRCSECGGLIRKNATKCCHCGSVILHNLEAVK